MRALIVFIVFYLSAFIVACTSTDRTANVEEPPQDKEIAYADDGAFERSQDFEVEGEEAPFQEPTASAEEMQKDMKEKVMADIPEDAEEEVVPQKQAFVEPARVLPDKPMTGNAMRRPASNCSMRSAPKVAGAKLGIIKKGRKIWTENHNSGWFKIYRKNGHAYMSKSCF